MRHWALGWALLVVSCGGGGGEEGGPCGPNGECPAGFECNPVDNICYRSSGGPDAGIDATPGGTPNTTLTVKPASLTNNPSATFEFTADLGGATFVCSLDAQPFAACSSPLTAPVDEGTHTFAVAAVLGTNQDATPETWTWQVDLTPPDTTITSGTTGSVSNSEATFSFTSSEAGSTFECRFDAGAFEACGSGTTFTGFTLGPHTFYVRAKDPAGNTDASPDSRTWTVDQTSPQTTIGSGPNGLTNDNDPSFTFSSDKPGSTFACDLDGGGFAPCTSPKSYTDVPDGMHTFSVTATDTAGNPDPSPAVFEWTIDTVAPVVTIDSGPPPGATTGPTVMFTFSSPESSGGGAGPAPPPPAIVFECQLDTGAIESCDSPKTYMGLGSGGHTFRVRATDAAQNTSAFVELAWNVDAGKPVVTVLTPANGGLTRGAGNITFTGSEAGMVFACSLDGTAVTPCASPVAYSFTTDASHTFQISGTARGVTSDTVIVTWRADGVVPTASITFPATNGVTTGPSLDVTFTASELVGAFSCKINNGSFVDGCESPLAVLLADGPNSVTVHFTDEAGNVSSDVVRSWTVDAVGPTTSAVLTPLVTGRTRTSDGQVSFSSPEQNVTFECRLYELPAPPTLPPFAACSSPVALSGFSLVDGDQFVFDVRGRDAYQNPGAAASVTATIDNLGPSITIPPPGTVAPSGTLSFTADAGTFTCWVTNVAGTIVVPPSGVPAACTAAAGLAYTINTSGSYTFHVDGTDGLNTSSASQGFTVDATPPTMESVSCLSNFDTGEGSCTFSSADVDVASYDCSVDGASFARCSSPIDCGNERALCELTPGLHTVSVRATDTRGNVGAPLADTYRVVWATGHLVLIGHDYANPSAETIVPLKNAPSLAPAFPPKNRQLRFLALVGPKVDEAEKAAVDAQIIKNYDVDCRTGSNDPNCVLTDDPNKVIDLIAGGSGLQDVLLIYDGQDPGFANAVGDMFLEKGLLSFFVGHGGVVIVIDGLQSDRATPSETFRCLKETGIPIDGARPVKEGTPLTNHAPADPLVVDLAGKGYDAMPNTVIFLFDPKTFPTMVIGDQSFPVVWHAEIRNGG